MGSEVGLYSTCMFGKIFLKAYKFNVIALYFHVFFILKKHMYFPLVFEVISRTCFALKPTTPFIVPSTLLLVGF